MTNMRTKATVALFCTTHCTSVHTWQRALVTAQRSGYLLEIVTEIVTDLPVSKLARFATPKSLAVNLDKC